MDKEKNNKRRNETKYRSGNSIPDSRMHFPLSLPFTAPPPFHAFSPSKRPMKLKAFWFYFTSDFSLIFSYRPDLWFSFKSKPKVGEKKISTAFFGHFFKNCASVWGVKSHQFWVRKLNSWLRMFPVSLYNYPPFPHFPPKSRWSLLTDFITIDFSLNICMKAWIVI